VVNNKKMVKLHGPVT